jgi:hypothetical protein
MLSIIRVSSISKEIVVHSQEMLSLQMQLRKELEVLAPVEILDQVNKLIKLLLMIMCLLKVLKHNFNNNNNNCNNNRTLNKSLHSTRQLWMSINNSWRSKSKCSNNYLLASSIWCSMLSSKITHIKLYKELTAIKKIFIKLNRILKSEKYLKLFQK